MVIVHGKTRPASIGLRAGMALLAGFVVACWLSVADAQQQCRVKGPTCTDAKAQCRALRKSAFPDKSNNPCSNRFRRCMAEGRYVSRNCNVVMEKR
jgi:hypothetical protein